MELSRLIEGLSLASAYPHPAEQIEVHHTHISLVFLAGSFVYKLKKPVSLGFLDFSTLAKRRHFCDEEVRLNRRLAPDVYLGVVPITQEDGGTLRVEGNGETIEWAVKMRRLPDHATLEQRLLSDQVTPEFIRALAARIASFHAGAAGSDHISSFGRFEMVAGNARENLDQVAPLVGTTLSPEVFARLRCRTETVLSDLQHLIEARARLGVPRDTHGDLHLDHIYYFPDKGAPDDLVIIDCIEFNERFRFADPIADMAFLRMDLIFHGRRDLAQFFTEEYLRVRTDADGRDLVPFYTSYRAAVRGKVEGFELAEKEVPEQERSLALTRARAHWLLALGELEEPPQKPFLLLVGGLPGTGKSTLARGLTQTAGLSLIRSDVVRKELAGIPPLAPGGTEFGEGIYAPAWTDATYAECQARAERLLFEGKRVVVDASFREETRRMAFLQLANKLAVPTLFFICDAHPEEVRKRLAERREDASDAGWGIYQQARMRWEEPGPEVRRITHRLPLNLRAEQTSSWARDMLRSLEVL